MATIQQQQEALTTILRAIADIIKGNNGTPSGVLYAALMQYGCTLEQYEKIILSFKSIGKVRESNFLLYWVN